MQTAIESRELIVWAPHKSLAEAKSLFASYAPKFQTVPCNEMTAFGKATVNVLYLSNPELGTTVENALVRYEIAECRSCWSTRLTILQNSHSAWNDGRTSEVHRG